MLANIKRFLLFAGLNRHYTALDTKSIVSYGFCYGIRYLFCISAGVAAKRIIKDSASIRTSWFPMKKAMSDAMKYEFFARSVRVS